MNAFVRAEEWRQVLAQTLNDNTLRLSTGVKMFADANLKSGSVGAEVKVVASNVGTDDINVLFYQAPDGDADLRSEQSMGSTHGLWDVTMTGTEDLIIRTMKAIDVGSGFIVGIQKAAGVTVNMVCNVHVRRFRGRD